LGPARSRFTLWTSVKIIVAVVLIFVLVRIAIPDLVNAHDTALLLLAVLCGVLAAAIAAWTVISIRRAWRRLKASGGNLIEVRK
jgi:hypothetical protein